MERGDGGQQRLSKSRQNLGEGSIPVEFALTGVMRGAGRSGNQERPIGSLENP